MSSRTVDDERRSGVHWLIAGVLFLALMLAMWRLVSVTNSEGDHDAQLLPLFALIPLSIGLFRLLHARSRRGGHPVR